MTREYAKLRLDIWVTGDIRKLSPNGQHLYLLLLTHPDLSYAGVTDWRPGRLAAMATGWSADAVRAAARELEAGLFIVVDEDTEEVLVRSFIRNDEIMKQPRLAVSMVSAYGAVASSKVRGVIIHELRRLWAEDQERDKEHRDKGWLAVGGGRGKAQELLSLDAVDPAGLPKGLGEGLGEGLAQTPEALAQGLGEGLPQGLPQGLGQGLGETLGEGLAQGLGSVSGDLTATTTTTSSSNEEERVAQPVERATRVPDGFAPNDDLVAFGRNLGFTEQALTDITAEFIDYWKSKPGKDGLKRDWPATWRNWVRKEDPAKRNRRLRPVAAVKPGGYVKPSWEL